MNRTLIAAAAIAILPAGQVLASPAECSGAWLLSEADNPHSCFRTGHGMAREQAAMPMHGAQGPVRVEMTRAEGCNTAYLLQRADDVRSCFKDGTAEN